MYDIWYLIIKITYSDVVNPYKIYKIYIEYKWVKLKEFQSGNIGEPEYHTFESAKRNFAAAFTFTGDSNAEGKRLVEFKNTVEILQESGDSYYMNYI